MAHIEGKLKGDNLVSEIKKIPINQFRSNVFELWAKTWFLLTSGDFKTGKYNSMTIAWGSIGIMWNRPFAMVGVRPTRYTFQFINQFDTFSLCAFPEEFRESLNILGTRSGKDDDKIKASGLEPVELESIRAPGFKQAELILECRKIYWEDFNPSKFMDTKIDRNYPNKDYHRIIFGEILTISGDADKYSLE